MTTMRSIACTACGADVPQGRLSCPSCGELLASVSGAMRSSWVAATSDDRPMLDALLDDQPPASGTLADADGDADIAPAVPLVLGLVDEAEPEPVQALDDLDPEPDPSSAEASPVEDAPASSWPAPRSDAAPAWPAPPADAGPSWPEPPPVLPLASSPPPGAYLPPTATPAPPPVLGAAAVAAVPAGPAAPARAWAGSNTGNDGSSPDVAAPDEAQAERAKVEAMIDYVAVAGCALALLGFLIPWARTMIGSSGTGYLDQWGLAGPGHVVIILGLGAIVIGAVAPNRIPARLRLGIPGLIVGAILIGLVWPYVLGPLGALPGAFLSLVGALTLVGASIASIMVDRHAKAGSAV